uniref:Uncharacterized protein n=1 Tax=Anguilla anguilla TaxID=7936 RepID=A0A0E9UJW6_ANGAN
MQLSDMTNYRGSNIFTLTG